MDELAKKFAELSAKYGPDVVRASLEAARIEGYSMVVAGVMMLLVGVITLVLGILVLRQICSDYGTKDNGLLFLCAGALMIVALIFTPIGSWYLVDPWTWAAVNHPEAYLAKKVFKIGDDG